MCFTISAERRPLLLVALARALSWLGDEVALVALLLRLQSSGVGAVSALLVCGLAPVVLLSGVVGSCVDRYDTRQMLLFSSAAQAIVCAVLAFVVPPWAVLALVASLGAGQAVNGAAWSTAIPALAADGDVSVAVAWMQSGVTLAGIVAPGIGGLLAGALGTGVPLLVDAASFVAVLAIASALPAMPRPARTGGSDHGGLTIVRRDPVLRLLMLLVGGFVLVGAMVNVVEVFLVRQTLGASSTWFGLCGTTYAVGALAGTLLASRWSEARTLARAFVGSAIVLGAGLAMMGLAPSIGWLLAAGVVAGVGQGAMNVAIKTLLLVRAPASEIGRVSALLNAVVSSTQLAAFVVGGVLAGVIGARAVFVLGGAVGLLVPAVFGRRMVTAAADTHRADLSSMTPDTAPLP